MGLVGGTVFVLLGLLVLELIFYFLCDMVWWREDWAQKHMLMVSKIFRKSVSVLALTVCVGVALSLIIMGIDSIINA